MNRVMDKIYILTPHLHLDFMHIGSTFLLEFALGRWYCSVLMMCKWSEWVRNLLPDRLCFVKVCTNFRWVLTNFTLSTMFQRVFLQLSSPLIFNLGNRKYISYTLCENEYALGMLYFSAHHSVPTLGTNILCNFLFICIFLTDRTFKCITFLSYMMGFCGLKNNLYSV